MQARIRLLIIPAILFGLVCQTSVAQQAQSAADILPGSTAIYVEVTNPADLIEKARNHPISTFVQEQKAFKDALASPQAAAGLLGIGVLESQIGESLLDSLKTNLQRGLYFAVDAETQGVAILFRSQDEAKLKKLASAVIKMASQANGGAIERKDYRDAKAAEIDGNLVARYKDWFLITNNQKLAKTIADNMHDGSKTPLSSQNWFVQAQKERGEGAADAWAAVDLKTIRMAGIASELFTGKTDNPGVELVMGGVLDALKNSPVAVAELNLDRKLALSVKTPFQNDWANSARTFFFGDNLSGAAPTPFKPDNMIASLISYRDVGGWWLSKEDLFEENVIAQLAQADSQISTIFSGLDFGEEVLGSFEPGVQIVVAENKFQEEYQPDVKLPAFAMVSKLKDIDNMQRRFKIAFQSVIGFANINLGMQGQPQLDLETENIGNSKISSAQYMFDKQSGDGLLLYNFAPTIAIHEPYFIMSSNRELAVELAELAAKRVADGETDKTNATNTHLKIDAAALRQLLELNREPLIANNMIEEGNTRAKAEEAMELIFTASRLIREIDLVFNVKSDQMSLDLEIDIETASIR